MTTGWREWSKAPPGAECSPFRLSICCQIRTKYSLDSVQLKNSVHRTPFPYLVEKLLVLILFNVFENFIFVYIYAIYSEFSAILYGLKWFLKGFIVRKHNSIVYSLKTRLYILNSIWEYSNLLLCSLLNITQS